MKILIIMDPGILIPVTGYGGIERIIELLAKEYLRMGHEVHLFVTSGSNIPGCFMHPFGRSGFPPKKIDARMAILEAWKFLWPKRNHFDLIHNFGRLIYLLPVLNCRVKKIMSYQREITKKNIIIFNRLPNKNMYYTGCSTDLIQRNYLPGNWTTIYNCCDFNFYKLNKDLEIDSAPLIFLGRIERVKGCHTAINIAKATNHQLIIAGNISSLNDEKLYFETEVKPLIDGKQIKYVGTLNDFQKNDFLGKSKALLMPIEWNEPFGIVMVEAMACGTPVLAFSRGAVNEVIEEGITGFKVDNLEDMCKATKMLKEIDRSNCREKAMLKFNISEVAAQYLSI